VAHTLHCVNSSLLLQLLELTTPTKAVRQQLTRSQVRVEFCLLGALSVGRRLRLEIPAQAEYMLLTKACCRLCKLDNQTKQVRHRSMWLLRSLQLAAGRSNAWKPCIALCRRALHFSALADQATIKMILHRLQEDRRS